MLWSRRTIFMGLLVGAPVLFALLVRGLVFLGAPIFEQNVQVRNGVRSTILVPGPVVFGYVMWMLYLTVIVPILGVFYGTSLMADEVEDKTITYLFVRPIRRGAVLLGKYLAYVVCTVFVVLPSVMLVYLLIVPINGSLGGSFIDLLKDLALLALGLAVYGAVFAFIGAKLKRPLLVGLMFIFGWEPAAMAFPGYMKRVHGRLLRPGPRPPRHSEHGRHERPPEHVPGDPEPARPACSGWRSSGSSSWPWGPGWSSGGNMCWSSRGQAGRQIRARNPSPDRCRIASSSSIATRQTGIWATAACPP